jgi:hypothetical protein
MNKKHYPELEAALHQMEAAATSFALRYIRMAEVRSTYVRMIREMSESIRASVESGGISAAKGAELAHATRNSIMDMSRARDFDLGRSLAQGMKTKGLTLEESIAKAMKNLGLEGKAFQSLSGADQNRVFMEVIESSGRSRASVTAGIPKIRWAGRGLWLASLLIAGYNIGTAENPWWQTGREASNIAGGAVGGFAGGAAMGAAGGIWAGPPGVVVGVIVGGILGALLADRTYVEVAGTADPATRDFIARFTSFWTGTDEDGLAQALARERRHDTAFMLRVFRSLEDSYSTDADDVAFAFVTLMRRDTALASSVAADSGLRAILVSLLEGGWSTTEEKAAALYVRGLKS